MYVLCRSVPDAYVNMFAASFDGTDLTALGDHIVSDDSQF